MVRFKSQIFKLFCVIISSYVNITSMNVFSFIEFLSNFANFFCKVNETLTMKNMDLSIYTMMLTV